jgi:hypothetical protein
MQSGFCNFTKDKIRFQLYGALESMQRKTNKTIHMIKRVEQVGDLGIIAETFHELHLHESLHTQEWNQGKNQK